MTLVELNAMFQSGVLSALVVLIFFKSPQIWAALLSFIERSRRFYSEQAAAERSHREDIANKTAAALQSLGQAIQELRTATHTICRYREMPSHQYYGETLGKRLTEPKPDKT